PLRALGRRTCGMPPIAFGDRIPARAKVKNVPPVGGTLLMRTQCFVKWHYESGLYKLDRSSGRGWSPSLSPDASRSWPCRRRSTCRWLAAQTPCAGTHEYARRDHSWAPARVQKSSDLPEPSRGTPRRLMFGRTSCGSAVLRRRGRGCSAARRDRNEPVLRVRRSEGY